MCGCDAPGSHHRSFGDFLGVAGGQKKIAHWAWRVGKTKMFWFIEPFAELGGQMAPRKRGTNMCRLTRAAHPFPRRLRSLPSLVPRFGIDQPIL